MRKIKIWLVVILAAIALLTVLQAASKVVAERKQGVYSKANATEPDGGQFQHAPVVAFELCNTGGEPVSGMPFEVEYLDGRRNSTPRTGMTNERGKAFITLEGWKPGIAVALYVPEKMEELCQVKEVEAKQPHPETVARDEDYYEQGFFKGDHERLHIMEAFWGAERVMQGKVPSWKELSDKDRARFRGRFQSEFRQAGERAKELAARKIHPNYLLFTPEAGRDHTARMTYHTAENEVNLRLRFVDASTSRPLEKVSGKVSEYQYEVASQGSFSFSKYHKLFDKLTQGDGRTTMEHLYLSHQIMQEEKDYLGLSREEQAVEKKPCIFMSASTPGFVFKIFEIPLESAQSGKELTCRMDREARVHGRVSLPDGGPLNAETIKAALARRGALPSLMSKPVTFMQNYGLERNGGSYGQKHYLSALNGALKRDGSFVITGLLPHRDWVYTVDSGFSGVAPKVGKMDLKAGDNDLGEMHFELDGALLGKVTDQRGMGLKDVGVSIADQDTYYDDSGMDRRGETDVAGRYQLSLRHLVTGRHVVRLIPPWGYQSVNPITSRLENVRLMYDAVCEVKQGTTHTLNARLDRGHTLFVDVPASPRLKQWVEGYRQAVAGWQPRLVQGGVFRTVINQVLVQGLAASPEGFRYVNRYRPTEAIELTSETMRFRIDHVPAGHHAVCIDGGIDFFAAGPGNRQGARGRRLSRWQCIMAYAEFTMPGTTMTLQTAPGATDLEIELTGHPEHPIRKIPGHFCLLERQEPSTTLFEREIYEKNYGIRTTYILAAGVPIQNPMVAKLLHFYGGTLVGGASRIVYRPALLQDLPPGTYRLRAYHDWGEFKSPAATPYYETSVEVPARGGKITVKIPYDPPQPDDAPQPVAE